MDGSITALSGDGEDDAMVRNGEVLVRRDGVVGRCFCMSVEWVVIE